MSKKHESRQNKTFTYSIVPYKEKSTKQSDGNIILRPIFYSFAVTLKTPIT